MIFRYDELTRFYESISKRFAVTSFRDRTKGTGILLRHDVDVAIEPAFKVAEIEKQVGITSTFFILTTGMMYNPAAPTNRKMLREMSDMGFEIGLHFDPSIYGDATHDELEKHVLRENEVLTSITQQPVESISIHNPSIHGTYPMFEGFNNAYDPAVFTPETYISDSRMVFRHNVHEFVERADSCTVQVLLHPIHYTEDGDNYAGIFNTYVSKFLNHVHSDMSVNSTYAKEVDDMSRLITPIRSN